MDRGRGGVGTAPAVTPALRPATPADGPAIADVWLASWRATFDFQPAYPDPIVRRWLTDELVPRHDTWVADDEGRVVGMMAMSDTMIEQLYLAPDWIGHGLGARFIALARERRPNGLDLYCFQVNARARSFYERHGFWPVAFGDGSGNAEHQPDVRYAWRPGVDQLVTSADSTRIASFRSGDPNGPPLVLVHGAAADHTTFRVVGPMLGTTFDVHAIDRRGRGASGDTAPYAIEREYEDVAAVATTIADQRATAAVDVFGHSYGGRVALGAALITDRIRRVISYEGAPTPPDTHYGDPELAGALQTLAAAGSNEELLRTFLARVVGMSPDELARYEADPVWPRRVAAAPTIAREVRVEDSEAAGVALLGSVRQPVLQILGGDSLAVFGTATQALDQRLADGRIAIIPGARHAAHHTHPDRLVQAVRAFLDGTM
jgi:pimeloyl-ACP methyl ester carboxylesterase/GNAT superfamily N-acetyltransferase